MRERLRDVQAELSALMVAFRHPRTPWYAKAWLLIVIAYALSPIDLIPDPIPVLGYLDDAILVPLGIILALKLIPPDVLEECRGTQTQPTSRKFKLLGVILVSTAWIITAALSYIAIRHVLHRD